MREGFEAIERAETDRKRWLESPEAVRQREESRYAWAEITSAQALEFLPDLFADQFAKLNSDPARFLSDAQLIRPLGEDETAASVKDEGDGSLLDAGMPVRVEDEAGELRKVDLTLEASAQGFEPVNPLTDLRIPDSATGAIAIGEEGLAVSPIGVDATSAQLLGDEDVYHHEVLPDTGFMVSPVSGGVELFNVLYSEESPETLRYDLDLPQGAELRSDGNGGAEIIRGGERLAMIPFPTAVDAQETRVPVEMTVEGTSLVLHASHREEDFAYPILVDPTIWENWYTANWINGNGLNALDNGAWQFGNNYGHFYGSTWPIFRDWGGSHRGLFVSTSSNMLAANTWGRWVYSAPNVHSYIDNVSLLPYWVDNHGCSKNSYPQPDDYTGLYGDSSWNQLRYNDAYYQGYSNLDSWGRSFHVGQAMAGYNVQMPCWRDLYVGGAGVWLDDWAAPTLHSITNLPTGWVSDAAPFTVTANVSDQGLGVHRVAIFPQGALTFEHQFGCSGLYGSRCPTSKSEQITLNADSFSEGQRVVQFSAKDPTSKVSNTIQAETKVDRTPPEVTLDGQLAVMTDEDEGDAQDPEKWDQLSLPVYNLKIEAVDGSNDKLENKRSGVKDIEIFLDDNSSEEEVPWPAQSCPASSCSMTQTYELKLNNLAAGKHTLRIIVVDQVGKKRERKIEFEFIPATGMKDEYVMHYFPLPDGTGNEAEEEHPDRPELAVNVMSGNLVYREKDVEVEGSAVDLEVERYYNSLLPTAENTEWGDGWALAQTPTLESEDTGGSPAPDEALLDDASSFEGGVELPTEAGAEEFDPAVQAAVTKTESGGFELTDETGESAASVAFDEGGQAEALLTDGYAKVDLAYEGGDLSEIAVEDPGSVGDLSEPGEVEPPDHTTTFASSFKFWGSGTNYPTVIDIGPDGSIWVGEPYKRVVQKFNVNGSYQGEFFGSFGSGNGQFSTIGDIAVAADGSVWATDAGNNRIQKFTSAGVYVSKFGTSGSGNGQLSYPSGIDIDSQGHVWVADTYNYRVQEFNAQGQYLRQFGSMGEGEGQFGNEETSGPEGIAVDNEDNVWVIDSGNNRIQKFNPEGEYLTQISVAGVGGIATDPEGNVWVTDYNNKRVSAFDSDGEPLTDFGSYGSGAGQFQSPIGIATNGKGGLWVTDPNNSRVQKWLTPTYFPYHHSAFGSSGTSNGSFNQPADSAADSKGNLWVVDKGNNRIQKFNDKGQYLSKFGSVGSGNGQMSSPSALALDSKDNIWVVDKGNNRIQKFDAEGKYVSQFGSSGTGNGQFNAPEGIAIDTKGNLWVSDTKNGRIQKFDENGNFIEVVGSPGSDPGELGEPKGIDFGLGFVWIADWQNNRVAVFDDDGEFISQFGTPGAGNGEFDHPVAIDFDANGDVWVGDQGNGRIQQFSMSGEYLGRLGSKGTGVGQFELASPMGIATDGKSSIWIVDANNHRVQRWQLPTESPGTEDPIIDSDPKVEIDASGGLISSLEGEEAGEHSYEHDGDDLVSHDGPDGESTYEYDANGRMIGVELPNGTWAEIAYYTTYGRVKSVTVDPAGSDPAKTTQFEYSDDPRRSVVIPSDAPHVTYDIGADGSVLKWWNTPQPPSLDDLSGTLYVGKETASPIAVGDHNLVAQAHSEEGIASIQFIANGNLLIDEMKCDQDPEEPGLECLTVLNEWVTETGAHAPGILDLEVITTDRLGHTESERFWVNIPYTPPPNPEAGEPPKFKDILRFREEHGLEVVFPVANELELNDRIFDLIGAWHNPQTPAGEVARASMARWGVPLRPADIAELEYRLAYWRQATEVVPGWVSANAPSTFAGFYLDEQAGGKIVADFTGGQAPASLAALEQMAGLMAGPDRIVAMSSPPSHTLAYLENLRQQVANTAGSYPPGLITNYRVDIPSNSVKVGASNVGQAQSLLHGSFGAQAPITVFYQPNRRELKVGRERIGGMVRAGDEVFHRYPKTTEVGPCTAGFGAFEKSKKPGTGEPVLRLFALSAGHCAEIDETVRRRSDPEPTEEEKQVIGKVTRSGYETPGDLAADVDATAIRLDSPNFVPRQIFQAEGMPLIDVTSAWSPTVGTNLCFSGRTSKNIIRCGPVLEPPQVEFYGDGSELLELCFEEYIWGGDSGSPVWVEGTGVAVGIAVSGTGGPDEPGLTPKEKEEEEGAPKEACASLLLPYENRPPAGTVFGNPDMAPLHLVTQSNARP